VKKLALVLLTLLPALALAAEHGGNPHEAGHHDIDWYSLTMQSITFVVFVVGLLAVARKPVAKYFLTRHEAVKAAVGEAQQAKALAEAKAREYDQKMKDLDAELKKLETTLAGSAEAEKKRLLEEAEAAAKKVQKDAEVAIATELSKAQEQLRHETAELAVKLAEDILRREIKADDHKRLVDDFVKSLSQGLNQKAA
jgi:F-type H+-transporting ATPase subunit b